MHAATVELLIQKAHLDPDTAVAIATAIDMALQNAQLVTIAVLDARFMAFEAKIDARFATADAKIEARFAVVDSRFDALEGKLVARMDARFAVVDERFDALETTLEAKMKAALEKNKAEVVRWVFLVMLGNVALSMAANAVLQHLH